MTPKNISKVAALHYGLLDIELNAAYLAGRIKILSNSQHQSF
jgi:hypothetical protein